MTKKTSVIKPRVRLRGGKLIAVIALILISLVAIFPFWTMCMMSTYSTADIYKGVKILPGDYFIENIKSLMQIDYGTYYGNSFIVAIATSVLAVFVSAMAGYGFAKYRFRGRTMLTGVVMLTLMVPVQLGIVGLVIEMKAFGWLNTLLPLIVPNCASAFGVYWLSQFTGEAVPDEVIESARIDGCGEFHAFLHIALPFMFPACTALLLISFLGSWNAFFAPSILLTNNKLFTLPLGIRQLATQYRFDTGAQICGLTFGTIPMLIVFSLFSKYLITGMSAAAVKG
ncbi:MAG: carbohydrate ABC transporter permease [Clostridia bacterium]|nr:carbohydrate ABC transporter permease [Clostridia bacterium]